MRVLWTRPALRDLEAIGDFVARDNAFAAAEIVTRIEGQTGLLARHPRIGRSGRIKGTRELVVTDTPFIVAYRLKEDRVEVLAVFHGARRWPDRFD
ncbi:MAG: type II toxin-antitoxin system RelE/ParE family toxin [Beijerinckiaceae bacterium]|nr:type II toxin-antitoxin system RelE/ParE family toxin [Beijerinckiaceae bacterium]